MESFTLKKSYYTNCVIVYTYDVIRPNSISRYYNLRNEITKTNC